MSKFEARNLILAVVEDEDKGLAAPYGLVDLVTFPPSADERLGSLDVHCRNAAIEKHVRFDLASIDMNFQADVDDPMRPAAAAHSDAAARDSSAADPRVMTASGLYHGLGLLARREATDDARNVFPLAWEVRSAAPYAFDSRTDLRNDALRGFALLRSLLASPFEGESLEACIRREHTERAPGAEPLPNGSLLQTMEADLLTQRISTGVIKDILGQLLPKWRRLFRAAVERREVLLHVAEMRDQLDSLTNVRHGGRRVLSVTQPSALCIPLQGQRESDVVGGIHLASVMADLVANGEIDVFKKTPLLGETSRSVSVMEWFSELFEAARSSGPWAQMFRTTYEQFEQVVSARGTTAVADLWTKGCHGIHKENKRFFLYILMRFRLWMIASPSQRDPDDRGGDRPLRLVYGPLNANDQTYLRPARLNRLVPTTAEELRAGLREALEHRSGLLVNARIWDDWLADELRRYCFHEKSDGGLGLNEQAVTKLAPGLVR